MSLITESSHQCFEAFITELLLYQLGFCTTACYPDIVKAK